jgi:hypothetical protein
MDTTAEILARNLSEAPRRPVGLYSPTRRCAAAFRTRIRKTCRSREASEISVLALVRVTGGKTLSEHIFSELPRIADMVESADSHRTV